jgi:cation diffusion facilitator family transporter
LPEAAPSASLKAVLFLRRRNAVSGSHHHHDTGRAAAVTLAVNLVLTCAKWIAFAVTRSPSLFGEAAHSTADALNPLVLWFGARRSRRPSHARHPAGHGREAFFWGLIAAQLMFAVGAVLTALHGIETLRSGAVPARSGLAIAVMAAALAGESTSLLVAWRAARRGGGGRGNTLLLALIIENAADILGVLLALAGYGLFLLTGESAWDGAFSLAIAALLACSSVYLMNRNRSLIVGESAPAEIGEKVRQAAARPSVAEVVSIRTMMRDPHHASCRIVIRWNAAWFRSRLPAPDGAFDVVAWTLAAERREREAIADAVRSGCDDVADVDVVAE